MTTTKKTRDDAFKSRLSRLEGLITGLQAYGEDMSNAGDQKTQRAAQRLAERVRVTYFETLASMKQLELVLENTGKNYEKAKTN